MCKEVRDWGLVHVAVVFISDEERFVAVVRRYASFFLVGIPFETRSRSFLLRSKPQFGVYVWPSS
jgi:hypothetical protein